MRMMEEKEKKKMRMIIIEFSVFSFFSFFSFLFTIKIPTTSDRSKMLLFLFSTCK